MSERPRSYFAFGFWILSDIPFPELEERALPEGSDPPVRIRQAMVQPGLDDLQYANPTLQVAKSEIKLSIPGIVRFHLRSGQELLVDPDPTAALDDVRAYLLATAFGLLCHQRGRLPLHANAMAIEGQAIAIAGSSGAGKSTLAAHFDGRGDMVLSDDVCALVPAGEGERPLVYAGISRIRLWKDSADALERPITRLQPVVQGTGKYYWPRKGQLPLATGLPLAALYVLSRSNDGVSIAIRRLEGAEALRMVMEQTFRREFLNPMGLAESRFERSIAVARQVPVFSVTWRHDFARLSADAELLREHAIGQIRQAAA